MTISDNANNSRSARRFVLYDNTSEVEVDITSPLFVSSAVAETGYTWQAPAPSAGTHACYTGVDTFKTHTK